MSKITCGITLPKISAPWLPPKIKMVFFEFKLFFSDNSYFIISSLRIFPTSTHLVKCLLGRLRILFEFIKSLLQKRTKYLFTLPKTRLGSYNKILILSNFAAKQIGRETYPPRPNTKSGFSFLKSKKELNKARTSFK